MLPQTLGGPRTARRGGLAFESLEQRRLLYSPAGVTWPMSDLSFSFVPDGGAWAGGTSELFAALDQILPQETWQREFARALQTWANQTNLNFHETADDGAANGLQGQIRLGATNYYGATANAYGPVSHAWGGDVVVNSRFTHGYARQLDFYTVMLHETGHSLGLGHSDDDDSIMRPSVAKGAIDDADIAAIQALYGVRAEDKFDLIANNNSPATATALTVDGSTAAWRADLTTHADVDHYRFTAPAGMSEATFSVDARELSLLAPAITVYDDAHRIVAQASGDYGTVAEVTVPLTAGHTYTVVADGATSDEFGMGAYWLRAEYAVAETPAAIDSTPETTITPPTSTPGGESDGKSNVPTGTVGSPEPAETDATEPTAPVAPSPQSAPDVPPAGGPVSTSPTSRPDSTTTSTATVSVRAVRRLVWGSPAPRQTNAPAEPTAIPVTSTPSATPSTPTTSDTTESSSQSPTQTLPGSPADEVAASDPTRAPAGNVTPTTPMPPVASPTGSDSGSPGGPLQTGANPSSSGAPTEGAQASSPIRIRVTSRRLVYGHGAPTANTTQHEVFQTPPLAAEGATTVENEPRTAAVTLGPLDGGLADAALAAVDAAIETTPLSRRLSWLLPASA